VVAKSSINIGFGTGTPAGMPDYKPINPWGRLPPKPTRKPREDLYQAVVLKADGTELPVGPKAGKLFVERCVAALNAALITQAKDGEINDWRSAVVVPVPRVYAS
jgi:hypothetical protein